MQPLPTPISVVLADCADSPAVERAIWELALRLPRARFLTRVWLASDASKEPFAAALQNRDVPVDRMPPAGSTWGWRGALETWMRLRRVRPAVLHVHHAWPTVEGVSGALAESAGVRQRVVTIHGARTPERSGAIVHRGLDRADAVTTVCRAHVERLVREAGIARDRVRCVPSGADLPDEEIERPAARAVRERYGAGGIRPLWLYAGRLEPHRGPQVFLDALGLVRDRGLPFVALLLGDGPLRDELEDRAAHLGLGASVHFLTAVEDPGPVLLAADAVVVPSLWDGVPGAVIESMMRGRPVIASALGVAADVIENGVNGRLVPAGDARALAEALESFHRRAEAAQRLGREGARRARAEFTWERVAEAYEAVYDEVLGLATFNPDDAAVARGRW